MCHDKQLRSAYDEILKSLDEAHSCLERLSPNGPDAHDAQRSGMFQLGVAGGLAFSYGLPGFWSEALFDDISDAAEQEDLDQIGRIRRSVAARLGPDEPPPAGRGRHWEAGPLQMIAVLSEARTAREDGNAVRFSLMAGFLVGLLSGEFGPGIRYEHGYLRDAVLAVHDRSPEMARSWVSAESIEAWEWEGESAGTDPQSLLLRWVGDRLAAAHRFSTPSFFHPMNESEDERRDREAMEREYYESEEASVQRAQNFGKRITGPDREGISVPASYSLNRALVLESHGKDRPVDGDHEE